VSIVADPGPALLPQWLEYGTRPHLIEARFAKALSFYWEKLGQRVVFHSAHHPGTQANQFLERSLDEMRVDVIDEIERAVRSAAQRVAA